MLIPDLHELADGDIQLHDGAEAMLPRLKVRERRFAESRAAIAADDPAWAFRVLAWLPASMCFSRLTRLGAGTT